MDNVYFKIIIPNYNNEKYIEKCLLSIQRQTFKDYKVILVDDMSTDSSFEIAKKFEQHDPQHFVCVKVEKKSYQGICRNIGIEYPIESKYTWFIDGDDCVESSDVLQKYKELTETYPDIDMFAFDYFQDMNGTITYMSAPSIQQTINKGIFCIIGIIAPWARLYKTSSIKDVRYKNVLFEDLPFLLEYLDTGPKIAEYHKAFYIYRINYEGDSQRNQRKDPLCVKRYQEMSQVLNDFQKKCKNPLLSQCIKNRLNHDGFKENS